MLDNYPSLRAMLLWSKSCCSCRSSSCCFAPVCLSLSCYVVSNIALSYVQITERSLKTARVQWLLFLLHQSAHTYDFFIHLHERCIAVTKRPVCLIVSVATAHHLVSYSYADILIACAAEIGFGILNIISIGKFAMFSFWCDFWDFLFTLSVHLSHQKCVVIWSWLDRGTLVFCEIVGTVKLSFPYESVACLVLS